MQGLGLALDGVSQDFHDPFDLRGRPGPVLGGEGVEGNVRDAFSGQDLQYGANVVDPQAVSCEPGEAALLGPTAVAVHHDGDVEGHVRAVDGPGNRRRAGLLVHPSDLHYLRLFGGGYLVQFADV